MSKAALFNELAESVEKASGRDQELDAEIAVAVLGGRIELIEDGNTHEKYPVRVYADVSGVAIELQDGVSRYTSSLDAAMTLVPGGYPIETMSWWPSVPAGYEDQRCCHLTLLELDRGGFAGLKRFKARAATPALALTAASLRARAQQESKDA